MGTAPTTTLRAWGENDLGVLEGAMGHLMTAQNWRYDLGGSR
ncbi:hypothetical protein [Georgenia subflava]|nr:hypothetical protein [Georgenia subflava]